MGAEIFKIEAPGVGDAARHWAPFMPSSSSSAEEISLYFTAINRNKKSVCIDFTKLEGQKIIHDLVKKCDVLIENYVPGKLDQYNLGYEQLKDKAPHLIYCSITGFGDEGPYKNRPGVDVVVASIGGYLSVTGEENGPPIKCGTPLTDICTGLYAHGAINAALLQRTKTKKGQKISCDLLSTQLSMLINLASNYLNTGIEPKRTGTAHYSIVPYESFETKDGYLTIGCTSDKHFIELCKVLQLSNLSNDLRFKTNSDRRDNQNILLPILREKLKLKTKKEWMEIFKNVSFTCGPVNTLAEVFDDPHVKYTGMVKDVEVGNLGCVKYVGPAVKYSSFNGEGGLPPPCLGEHTVEVLTDLLKYDKNFVNNLKKTKIIQ